MCVSGPLSKGESSSDDSNLCGRTQRCYVGKKSEACRALTFITVILIRKVFHLTKGRAFCKAKRGGGQTDGHGRFFDYSRLFSIMYACQVSGSTPR